MSPVVMYAREFEAPEGTDTVADVAPRMPAHRGSDLPIVDASGKLPVRFRLDRLLAAPRATAER